TGPPPAITYTAVLRCACRRASERAPRHPNRRAARAIRSRTCTCRAPTAAPSSLLSRPSCHAGRREELAEPAPKARPAGGIKLEDRGGRLMARGVSLKTEPLAERARITTGRFFAT